MTATRELPAGTLQAAQLAHCRPTAVSQLHQPAPATALLHRRRSMLASSAGASGVRLACVAVLTREENSVQFTAMPTAAVKSGSHQSCAQRKRRMHRQQCACGINHLAADMDREYSNRTATLRCAGHAPIKRWCRSARPEPLLPEGEPTRQVAPRSRVACKSFRHIQHCDGLDSVRKGQVTGQTPRRDARLDAQRGAGRPMRHASARRSPGAASLGRPVVRGTRCAVLPHLPRGRRRPRRADLAVHVQGCATRAPPAVQRA